MLSTPAAPASAGEPRHNRVELLEPVAAERALGETGEAGRTADVKQTVAIRITVECAFGDDTRLLAWIRARSLRRRPLNVNGRLLVAQYTTSSSSRPIANESLSTWIM